MTAYAETYLMPTMENLGEMADCATRDLGLSLPVFWKAFVASDMARLAACGSPRVAVGLSGTEMAVRTCEQAGLPMPKTARRSAIAIACDEPGAFRGGLGRAYWCGWAVGYYQWRSGRSFGEIERGLPIASVERMYPTFHEESEERFAEAADEMLARTLPDSPLKRQRAALGLSQSQLARRSGVGLRAIQQYEQGSKDIRRASAENVERLAQALHCEPRLLLSSAHRIEYAAVSLPEI